jgi:hypothetical protein
MRGVRIVTTCWVIAAWAAAPPLAQAVDYHVRDLHPVSAGEAFPATCERDGYRPHLEGEPALAVSPRDGRRVALSWLQDPRQFFARESPVAVSSDGGKSFTASLLPTWTDCTGGQDTEVNDPSVAIGGDGTTYVVAAAQNFPAFSHVEVGRSLDGGRTWHVTRLDHLPGAVAFADSPRITASRSQPGTAYLVWVQQAAASPTRIWQTRFSRTTDSGATWSSPRTIHQNAPGEPTGQFNRIFELPDGALLDVFLSLPADSAAPRRILAMRSEDGGQTWSAPATAAEYPNTPIADPETKDKIDVRAASAAMAPDGTVHVVWQDDRAGGGQRLLTARSGDGGRTWSATGEVVSGSGILVPAVAAGADGTIAVTYYDTGVDRAGDKETTTEVHLAHSHDGGRSWPRQRIAGPFDLRSTLAGATDVRSRYFLGDVQALLASGSGFLAAFAQGSPQALDPPGDVFFARLEPPARSDSPEPPRSRPRMRISVRPTAVRAGSRARLRVSVSASIQGRLVPLRDALVRLGRRHVTTDRDGRVALTYRFASGASRRHLRITKPGYRTTRRAIRVLPRRGANKGET